MKTQMYLFIVDWGVCWSKRCFDYSQIPLTFPSVSLHGGQTCHPGPCPRESGSAVTICHLLHTYTQECCVLFMKVGPGVQSRSFPVSSVSMCATHVASSTSHRSSLTVLPTDRPLPEAVPHLISVTTTSLGCSPSSYKWTPTICTLWCLGFLSAL